MKKITQYNRLYKEQKAPGPQHARGNHYYPFLAVFQSFTQRLFYFHSENGFSFTSGQHKGNYSSPAMQSINDL